MLIYGIIVRYLKYLMKHFKLWFLKLIDVYEEEFSEVFVMWFLSFIYRVCMVLGWTVMVAFFVGQYDIIYLPVLFALHSFTNILGSLVFGKFINKFEKSHLTLYLSLVTAFVFAVNAFVYSVSPEVFLITALIGVSLFLSQFKIVRSLFAEGIFSPTQATRVFPVIESAETIGVLLGGALVAILSILMPLNKIFLVMVVLMLMCVPTMLYYMDKSILIPYRSLLAIPEKGINIHEGEAMDMGLIKSQLKNNKFVLFLFLIVLFQFVFFGILEYHFTFVVEEFSKSYHDSGELKSNLAADLGTIHAIFAAVVLGVQLLLTSRLLKSIGAISTMLISPIVMILSVIGMLVGFSFPTVLLARFNQEVTHVLHYNAYHTSYYALSHKFRTAVIELLEGVVRPLGNLIAMITLFSLNFLVQDQFVLFSNLFSVLILGLVILFTIKFGKEFNYTPIRTLQMQEGLSEHMNAVEILESVSDKTKNINKVKDILLHKKDIHETVKGRLFKYLGRNGSSEDIFFLMDQYLDHDCKGEILEAINDLFERYSDKLSKDKFTLEYIYKFYGELLDSDLERQYLRELIIFLSLFYIKTGNISEILSLSSKLLDEDNCLYFTEVLGEINDKGIYYVFKDLLYVDNAKIRMAYLSVLDKYMDDSEIKSLVRSCLVSSDENAVVSGLMYLLVSERYDLIEFYEAIIADKALHSVSIKFCYEFIKSLHYESGDFYMHLKNLDISDVDNMLHFFKEWRVDNSKMKIINSRYEMELYKIYDLLPHELDSDRKLEMLYTLKNCYKYLGANQEYFMMKDLLS